MGRFLMNRGQHRKTHFKISDFRSAIQIRNQQSAIAYRTRTRTLEAFVPLLVYSRRTIQKLVNGFAEIIGWGYGYHADPGMVEAFLD